MKILYGVVGEGMGHATRSKVILDHLSQNNEIMIVASGKAHTYLKKFFPDIIDIEGLHINYKNGVVDKSETFLDFVKGLPQMISHNVEHFIELSMDFSPEAVISDFESFAYLFGISNEIPVISIDNMQILNRCNIDIEIPQEYMNDYLLDKAIVKAKLPGCFYYLITTFFYPPIRKEVTGLFPPILRPEILNSKPSKGEHILVYQTSATNQHLIDTLKGFDIPFIIYGFGKDETIGNLNFKAPSVEGFINDLVSSRAVIANGGFSLMSECVYLGKPMLSIPVGKQFEQILNALYLQKLGYGDFQKELTKDSFNKFIKNIDKYGENLKKHTQDGNNLILKKLDELLAELEWS